MQVYKVFMKMARKRLVTILMYFGIFALICFIMTANAQQDTDYSDKKLKISVADMDNTEASRSLRDYISENHEIVTIDGGDGALQDAIYYRTLNCSLTIKAGFGEAVAAGEGDGLFEMVSASGTYESQLFEGQLTQFVKTAEMYSASGMGSGEACRAAAEAQEQHVDVTVENFSAGNSGSRLSYFTQYLAYIFLVIMIVCFTPILSAFNTLDLRRRIDCSALPLASKNMQLFCATGTLTAAIWLVFQILGVACYGGEMFSKTGLLAMLNSFIFMVVAVGITVLIAQFGIAGDDVCSMIGNTVSLGMAFLCGVFVPQDLLGDGVLKAASFLPAYWLVRANNMLFGLSDEGYSLGKYLSYLGIEALFAVVLFAAAAVVAKVKRQSAE